MKNITITIWVEPSSMKSLMTVLKVLEPLDVDNDYVFTPSDIKFSKSPFMPYWYQINIPIEDYFKFIYCYQKLGGTIV